MRARRLSVLSTALLVAALAGCSAATGKGPEADAPTDGKFDSFAVPTDHGKLSFGGTVQVEITAAERFHAYTFHLDSDADIDIQIAKGIDTKKPVDTVLYLYRRSDEGRWGSYISKNDDNGDSVFSHLARRLPVGDYRFLVKGYNELDLGRVAVSLACEGEGCAIPSYADATCAFGTSYRDIKTSPNFEILERATYEVPADVPASRAAAVIASVVWNWEGEVESTLEAALNAVDDGGINFINLKEVGTGKEYWSFEYGSGDNSYGAVVDPATTKLVVQIQDGDLYDCRVKEPAGRWNNLGVKKLSASEAKANLPAIKDLAGAKLTGLPEAGDHIPVSVYGDVMDDLHDLLGQECDAVPTREDSDINDERFPNEVEPSSFTYYLAEQEREGWQEPVPQLNREALDAYLTAHDDTVDIYEMSLLPQACAGEGGGRVYILHERTSHTLFYVFSIQYAE